MGLMPTSESDQKKLLAGLLPVLGLFLYWYFYHPGIAAEIETMTTRLEDLESKNASARRITARAGPQLEEKLALYQEHIVHLEQLVPRTEEVSELLHTIALRAQENRVNLVKIEPELNRPGPFYTERTYALRVVGAYHDVGRFLATIGSLSRIITPIDLNLQPNQAEANAGTVQADFRIQTYVVPDVRAQSPPEESNAAVS